MANAITYLLFNLASASSPEPINQNEGVPVVVNVIDENGTTGIYSRTTPITKPTSIPDSPYIEDTGPAGAKQVEIIAYGPLNISGIDVGIGIVPK